MEAVLLLEDGTVFKGTARGKIHNVLGEVVFNTSMTGYQEILTDPSYTGQIVTMTFPLIGNYGINSIDMESDHIGVKGFVVRELCDFPSNFRCEKNLEEFLIENNICALEGIDTRALTKIIREKGAMNGAIIAGEFDKATELEKIKKYKIVNPVLEVTVKEVKTFKSDAAKYNIAMWDFGYKRNILNSLIKRGCDVTLFPADTEAEKILSGDFDGVMLTNGPGDPKDCKSIIGNLRKVIESGIPVFGICLGHQLTALAMGGDTEKLKYGHRGTNHPVKELESDRTYITSQNHGYAVRFDSIPESVGKVSHININDNTVEGVKYNNYPVRTVQFHPEASAGAMDTGYLFDEFLRMVDNQKKGAAL